MTSESSIPLSSISVRARHTARSLSPRVNVVSNPMAARDSMAFLCVVCPAPAARSDDASQRVEHRIGVGSHVNAVSFGVVTDVHDDGEMARIKHMT